MTKWRNDAATNQRMKSERAKQIDEPTTDQQQQRGSNERASSSNNNSNGNGATERTTKRHNHTATQRRQRISTTNDDNDADDNDDSDDDSDDDGNDGNDSNNSNDTTTTTTNERTTKATNDTAANNLIHYPYRLYSIFSEATFIVAQKRSSTSLSLTYFFLLLNYFVAVFAARFTFFVPLLVTLPRRVVSGRIESSVGRHSHRYCRENQSLLSVMRLVRSPPLNPTSNESDKNIINDASMRQQKAVGSFIRTIFLLLDAQQ